MLQTFRNIFSKRVSSSLSPGSTSLCRFLFGFPIAFAAVFLLVLFGGRFEVEWGLFLLMCLGMGVFQLIANVFLVMLFSYKNFAVSMTLIKTEAIILAFLGIFILGEYPTPVGWLGISIATCGLMAAAFGKALGGWKSNRTEIGKMIFSTPSLLALGAGVCLALCSIFLKKSSQYISSETAVIEVAVSLSTILGIQALILLIVTLIKNPGELKSIFRTPGQPAMIGLFAVGASFCWFSAFSINLVAYVRTLGQVEFLFGAAASLMLFNEKLSRYEVIGMVGVVIGTVLLFF